MHILIVQQINNYLFSSKSCIIEISKHAFVLGKKNIDLLKLKIKWINIIFIATVNIAITFEFYQTKTLCQKDADLW